MRRSDFRIGLIFFAISLLIKLPYLGTFLTIDERRWINGAGQFLLALRSGDFAQTYWHFHPGITITWGEAIILWLQSLWVADTSFEAFVRFQMEHLNLSVGAMRLSGVILTSATLPFVYLFAKALIGQWPAILGVGLIAVNPFWVAHSRIVNGDALAGVLMIAAFLSFALLLIRPDLKLAIVSGIFVGLSFLTKLPSQILVPLILLLALIGFINNRNWRFWLKALVWCGMVSTVVFFMLWPAMWVAPVDTLAMMVEDTFVVGDIGGKGTVEFFMGQVRETQSQLFYPLALLFRLTPINLGGAMLTLALYLGLKIPEFWRHNQRPNDRAATLPSNSGGQTDPNAPPAGDRPADSGTSYLSTARAIIVLWLFILVVIVLANVSPKKADRYVLSVALAIDLLAGIGWIWLVDRVTPLRQSRGGMIAVVTTLVAVQLVFVLLNYPYVLTYYNPLLGGFAKAAQLVPVGRGEGLEQAAAWINSRPDGGTATVSPYYRNVSNYYLDGQSLHFSDTGESQILADYVVFYITQTQRQLPNPQLTAYFQERAPAYIVNHGDTPLAWVYERDEPVTKLRGKPEIVGRAQLVGYHISNEGLSAGTTTGLTLYLLAQDQDLPGNEDFKVSLIDGEGIEHGIWMSSGDNQWMPNGVVEWSGQLALPPDTLSGRYRLKVALIDTNINAEVTDFPFEDEIINVAP
jgi:hypothetical protein